MCSTWLFRTYNTHCTFYFFFFFLQMQCEFIGNGNIFMFTIFIYLSLCECDVSVSSIWWIFAYIQIHFVSIYMFLFISVSKKESTTRNLAFRNHKIFSDFLVRLNFTWFSFNNNLDKKSLECSRWLHFQLHINNRLAVYDDFMISIFFPISILLYYYIFHNFSHIFYAFTHFLSPAIRSIFYWALSFHSDHHICSFSTCLWQMNYFFPSSSSSSILCWYPCRMYAFRRVKYVLNCICTHTYILTLLRERLRYGT